MSKWRVLVSAFCSVGAILCLGWILNGTISVSYAAAPATSPAKIVTQRIEALEVGKPQTHGNLTIFPITGRSVSGLVYLTLDEAMRDKVIEITESGSGSVNEVVIRNKSGRRVFIMDGEEIVGAKQNRVLNSSVLIGAEQTAKVPVSCVEHGRWTGDSMSFRSGGTQLFAKARQANTAAVNMNMAAMPSAGARSDQGRVWADVAEKRAKLSLGDSSGPMHEAYVKRHGDISGYLKAFHAVTGQVGVVCAVNGKIVGADIFDQSSTLKRLFDKLIKSYALDAIETSYQTKHVPSQSEAERFVRRVLAKGVSLRDYDSPGEGRDVRISSRDIQGSSLVASSRPVHIALFAPVRASAVPIRPTEIRPMSQRSPR